MTIEEAKDLTTLTMDELMGTLQTHEHWINRSTTSQEQTFKAQENSRGRGRGRNGSGRGSRSRGHERNGQTNIGVESSGRESNKREQAPLKTTLEEVRRITTPIRVMLNATIVISMGIMQVNAGNRVISQRKMIIWLM